MESGLLKWDELVRDGVIGGGLLFGNGVGAV